ncbi:MAG: hypothetical protein AAF236_02230 [Verrucomicrobiota bacterium]
MIRAGLRFDTRRLGRAITALARETGADIPGEINNAAKFVAINAYRETKPAGVANIRRELAAVGRNGLTLAENIVMKRAKSTAQRMNRAQVKAEARRLIARRASSSSYLRAGFIPAFRTFGSRGGGAANKFASPPGSARAARRGRRPTAVISHFDRGIVEQYPGVLRRAVNRQTRFLERTLARKIEARAKSIGFRTRR